MILSHDWRGKLDKCNIKDSQFHYGYASLYGDAEMFFYEKNGDSAFLIFIPDLKSKTFESPYGYGSFYSTSYKKSFTEEFFRSLTEYMAGRKIIAGIVRFHPGLPAPESPMFKKVFIRKVAAVKDPVRISVHEDSKCRNMVRRGWKSGVDIAVCDKESDFCLFGEIYRKDMKRKGASEELKFKDSYFSSLFALPSSRLIAAFSGNEMLGGAVMLLSENGFSYYHLSALNERGIPGLSNALLHHGISICGGYSNAAVMLGGGTTSEPDDPLLRFKSGFSNEMLDFYLGAFIIDRKEYSARTNDYDIKHPNNKGLFLRFKYEKQS